jgi:hypothetical protein
MIVASAILLTDGRVFVGKRHNDCFSAYKKILQLEEPDESIRNAVQGFITDKLDFCGREEAYYYALSCGQLENEKETPCLMSEDLW